MMGEPKTPNPSQSQSGNQPDRKEQQRDRESASRPGHPIPQPNHPLPNPQQDRDSATRQPGKRFPDENRQPNERASNPNRDMGESDAARRQSRQDPLQNRDR